MFAFSLLALTGCVSTYEINSAVPAKEKLSQGKSAYVALSADGRYDKENYTGSGAKTTYAVVNALKPHVSNMEIATEVMPYEQSVAVAKQRDVDYLFVPKILHWENRATEWSGIPDRIQIELRTIDAHTGKTMDIGDLRGKSKWVTLGGDVPEELLEKPITQYINSLYGVTPKKRTRLTQQPGTRK
jgi:hypothetical protein